MKVILDTNVIISAFLWNKRTSQILDLIENQKIIVYTCPEQIIELNGVLSREKFRKILDQVKVTPEKIVSGFLDSAILVKQAQDLEIIKNDPADNNILSCALISNAKYLVTGDKDLLDLKKIQKTKILSVRELLEKFK